MQKLFYSKRNIILASASPRRQHFLQELGFAYTTVCPHGVEPSPLLHENPITYALRAASAKAHFVAQRHKEHVVIAADTVVALHHDILGKPIDEDHALAMLMRLAGQSHHVISAVSIVYPIDIALSFTKDIQSVSDREELFHASTTVHFHNFHKEILENYARSGEPMDKAGAYAIQGQGAFLVSRIEGSWSNVVGLPVTELVQKLLQRHCIAAANGYCPTLGATSCSTQVITKVT